MLTAMGYEVYDCDLRARLLMEAVEIKELLKEAFGSDIFDSEYTLIRPNLAAIVFSDPVALERLNTITHAAVRADLADWRMARCDSPLLFVETAILYQSGLDRMIDEVWEVTAPYELRIERVEARNGLSRKQIEERILAQDSFIVTNPHTYVSAILNDGIAPLLPQIESLLNA